MCRKRRKHLRRDADMSAQAAALLTQLATLGVAARAVGAALRLSPASKVPPELLDSLRTHKAALLALLSGADAMAPAPAPEPETPPAEPIAETWPDEGSAGIPRRYPGAVAGLLRASQCRPVSWADPAARPSPGSWCRHCENSRWWADASGWRCSTCHPPDGAAPGTIEEVRT